MIKKSIGFIGGGRITHIILEGFKRKNQAFKEVAVSDINLDTLNRLIEKFPEIKISPNDNQQPASKDIVFIALHPPVISSVLNEIKTTLKSAAALISLAPKLTISKLTEHLENFRRVIRMIPNACSVINAGYNPIVFSQEIDETERKDLLNILAILGECPEVDEEKLEAYVILTGMGPTYLWFQLYELEKIGTSFGLTPEEVRNAVSRMAEGTAKTMFETGLMPEEVMDLIPVRPLEEEEENIKGMYRARLGALFNKLKSLN
ncbi:MAG: pyrroline-5-carboxylate reductase family protein [Candidatus Aminicenantaceae bacterium]